MSKELKELSAESFIRLIESKTSRSHLLRIIPDAETLVKFVTKYKDTRHDIMAALVKNNKIDTFDKIIDQYFSEDSGKNKRLRREFITSHAKGEQAKDFHYFSRYFPPSYKQKIQAMLTPDENLKQKILQAETPAYTVTDEISQKLSFYYHIQTAYTSAIPEIFPYCGKVASQQDDNAKTKQETYPCIRFIKIPKDQKIGAPESFKTFDIMPPYDPKEHNLARNVFNSMHFPDFWMEDEWSTGKGYFNFLNEFDNSYHQIKENDPISYALFKKFELDKHFIALENVINLNHKGNSNPDVKYAAYAGETYIGFRCDIPYHEEYLLHELAHNVGEFENTDIYHFITIPLDIQREKSTARFRAVDEALENYPQSEFASESLARIVQTPKNDPDYPSDPLFDATRKLFFTFTEAKTKNSQAIINRINLCARTRILGYTHFENTYKYLNQLHTSQEQPDRSETAIQKHQNNFIAAYKKIEDTYRKENETNVDTDTIENHLIKCIEQEIKAIEQIKQHPSADKVILDVDTLARDNITENTPLETLIADTVLRTKRLYQARTHGKSIEELTKSFNAFTTSANQNFQTLREEEKEGLPLDRNYYLESVANFCKSMVFANALIQKYNPQHNTEDYSINIYLPNSNNKQGIDTISDNLKLINSQNADTKISPRFMEKPFFPIKEFIDQGENEYNKMLSDSNDSNLRSPATNTGQDKKRALKIYRTLKKLCNTNPKDDWGEETKNLRLMQLLYREINPTTKELPQNLRFDSLSYKDFEPTQDGISPVTKSIKYYARKCINSDCLLNMARNTQTQNK